MKAALRPAPGTGPTPSSWWWARRKLSSRPPRRAEYPAPDRGPPRRGVQPSAGAPARPSLGERASSATFARPSGTGGTSQPVRRSSQDCPRRWLSTTPRCSACAERVRSDHRHPRRGPPPRGRRPPGGYLQAARRRVYNQNAVSASTSRTPMNFRLRCHLCHAVFPAAPLGSATKCSGRLEVRCDYAAIPTRCRAIIEKVRADIWRLRALLPIDGKPRTGIHSGFTPLVKADRLAQRLGVRELYVKDDSVNHPRARLQRPRRLRGGHPRRRARLQRTFACASTGNLAGSVAAHAARSASPARSFIPDDLEAGKIAGAPSTTRESSPFAATSSDVNRLCTQVADRYGLGLREYQLARVLRRRRQELQLRDRQQLGWAFPATSSRRSPRRFLPRILKGFDEMRLIGLLDHDLPAIHMAQAAGCAPVVDALEADLSSPSP